METDGDKGIEGEVVDAAWPATWLAGIGWKRYNRQRLIPGILRSALPFSSRRGFLGETELGGTVVAGGIGVGVRVDTVSS